MATTTSITTTYAGEHKGKIISAALLAGNTLGSQAITFRPNVKYQEVVRRLETDGIVKDSTCDFTDTSTLTSTERLLTPKELQVNLELCKKDWVDDWAGVQMGYSAFDNMPKSIQDYIIQYVASKVAQTTETSIWQGADGAGDFDGFETLLAADAALPAAQEVAGTTVSATNVIAELGKVVDAIPSSLYGNPDLYIYVSQNVFRAYKRALGGFGASGLGANGYMGKGNNQDINVEFIDGVKIFMANGLSDNTMIATTKDNLWFGTGLMSDHNEVRILDMSDLDGSRNFRVIMRYSAGVQYGVVQDIVTYGITNSAN
jgi:hypothetical protein